MPRIDLSRAFEREAARLAAIGRDTGRARDRALGTLARRLPVQARRDIQTEYALKAARIREGLYARRDGASAVDLYGRKRGIGLIEFGGRWKGRKSPGATAKVYVGEAAHNYAGTFIARGRGGNRQIFDRVGKRRLPIKTLYGPSVAVMLRDAPRRERLGDFAQSILATEIDRLLRSV